MKLKTKLFDGRQVDLQVSDDGKFFAQLEAGEMVRADTLADLERKVSGALRRASVRVHVAATLVRPSDGSRRDGRVAPVAVRLTGVHARSGLVLFKMPDGSARQQGDFRDVWLKELDAGQLETFVRLEERKRLAAHEYDVFVESVTVDPHELIRAALVAAGAPPEGEE